MTVYLSTTFASKNTPVTGVLELLRERGVTAVELGSIHCWESDLTSRLKRFNMDYIVHNYFPPPEEKFVVNIASRNRDIRKCSIEHAKSSISFCAEIGARMYTCHPGFITDPDGESTRSENYDFRFQAQSGNNSDYEESFKLFLDGTKTLSEHARTEGVTLAVESQGSRQQYGHLLLQRPGEFTLFFKHFNKEDVGLNVNLGHLNLASRVYEFVPSEFISQFSHNIVALEISHNDGYKDDHAALKSDGWYWPVITDDRLSGVCKIFEGRNIPVDTAVKMVYWLEKVIGERGRV